MTWFNSTEHPIIWFRDRYLAGELELRPPFQRQPVWAAKQKCSLIESILLEYPVPEVYVQHVIKVVEGEEKSMYYVVDGQQRIRSVLQFLGTDATPSEAEWNKFPLDKLDAQSPFKDMEVDDLPPTAKNLFLKYRFSVRQLELSDDARVRDMFKRLNKYLTKLNDQELRNATFTGPFIQLAMRLADDKFWAESDLVSPAQIRRMKDIEYVSDLLIGVIHGPQAGNARTIDGYYTQYEDFEDEFPQQKTIERRFSQTLECLKAIMPQEEDSRLAHNRVDFYSLFVSVASLIKAGSSPKSLNAVRSGLRKFEQQVDKRLEDQTVASTTSVITYVRAVEKGVSDKKRRTDRHEALLKVIAPLFTAPKS
jgi:hypothetical protein